MLGGLTASDSVGKVHVGPFTFDEDAFATDARQVESGTVSYIGDATNLKEALAGYSPMTHVLNIGYNGAANLFEVDFGLPARNGEGDDIVFFDADRGGEFAIQDRYEIAVRPKGGEFTDYAFYSEQDFLDTGVLAMPGGPPYITLFGLPLDLSEFGLDNDDLVDAMRFRALPGPNADQLSSGMPQGDPVMVGVLDCVAPEVINIVTHGFGNDFDFGPLRVPLFPGFLDIWYTLGTELEGIPEPGSRLTGILAARRYGPLRLVVGVGAGRQQLRG